MPFWVHKLSNRTTQFRSQESGAATIEFVLWVPVIALVFGLVADTALIFGSQARVLRVIQDSNRAMSVGRIRDIEVAKAFILNTIGSIAPNASVNIVADSNTGVISTVVLMPVADLTATGLVDALTNFNVTVFAQHLAES